MPPVAFLLILAFGAVLLARSKSTPSGGGGGTPPPSGGPPPGGVPTPVPGLPTIGACSSDKPYFGGTDADLSGLPEPYKSTITTALLGTDPTTLDNYADNLECFGYKLAAAKFRAKAKMLRSTPTPPKPGDYFPGCVPPPGWTGTIPSDWKIGEPLAPIYAALWPGMPAGYTLGMLVPTASPCPPPFVKSGGAPPGTTPDFFPGCVPPAGWTPPAEWKVGDSLFAVDPLYAALWPSMPPGWTLGTPVTGECPPGFTKIGAPPPVADPCLATFDALPATGLSGTTLATVSLRSNARSAYLSDVAVSKDFVALQLESDRDARIASFPADPSSSPYPSIAAILAVYTAAIACLKGTKPIFPGPGSI